jgi:hypothetical protein
VPFGRTGGGAVALTAGMVRWAVAPGGRGVEAAGAAGAAGRAGRGVTTGVDAAIVGGAVNGAGRTAG